MGIPLVWALLPSAGNSNTQARNDLLGRLLKVFPDLKIASLMGGREFIGNAWMSYLCTRKIPFVLRLRENQHVVRAGYDTWSIADIARCLAKGDTEPRMVLPGAAVDLAGIEQLGRKLDDAAERTLDADDIGDHLRRM